MRIYETGQTHVSTIRHYSFYHCRSIRNNILLIPIVFIISNFRMTTVRVIYLVFHIVKIVKVGSS
jgi:hypothetical protein